MAKDLVQSIRIKGEMDTTNIEQGLKRIRDSATNLQSVQSGKLNDYFSKLSQSFAKLNSMNLTGINNAGDLKEYERTIFQINKDLETFNRTAASAMSSSKNLFKEDVKHYRNSLKNALKVNAPGIVNANSLSEKFFYEVNKQSLTATQKEEIKYQDILNKSIKETVALLQEASTKAKTPDKQAAIQNEITRLNKITVNTPIKNDAGYYVQSLIDSNNVAKEMENLSKETENSTKNQALFRTATNNVVSSLNEQFKAQKQINDQFAHFQNYVGYMFSFASILTSIKRVINSTVQDVTNLDKAFGSIAMVTNYSVQDMWNSYGQYAEMANRLGQSTKDVIESSALFYQQGLKTADALSLTESTMKLATLAGSDFSTATSQMTAAIRGFNLEMEDSSHITDVYSELAANAAADVNGIAYALSKAAAIADSAGMSFENTAAFLAKMIESTQEAPENLGTALKTVIARFTELKSDVSGLTETELEGMDLNKVDTALKSVGVQLKKSNGEFRNLDEVFLELSSKWNTMSRNSQRYVATIAAGSRQQSRFIALMENYSRTLELVETAEESAGRSSEQFAKYQDTIEYKIKQLKNTWEQFRTSFLNQDDLKNAVNIINSLLEKLQKLNLTQIASALMLVTSFGVSGFKNTIGGLQTLTNSVSSAVGMGLNEAMSFAGDKLKNTKFFSKLQEGTKASFTEGIQQAIAKRTKYNHSYYNGLSYSERVDAEAEKSNILKNRENGQIMVDMAVNRKNELEEKAKELNKSNFEASQRLAKAKIAIERDTQLLSSNAVDSRARMEFYAKRVDSGQSQLNTAGENISKEWDNIFKNNNNINKIYNSYLENIDKADKNGILPNASGPLVGRIDSSFISANAVERKKIISDLLMEDITKNGGSKEDIQAVKELQNIVGKYTKSASQVSKQMAADNEALQKATNENIRARNDLNSLQQEYDDATKEQKSIQKEIERNDKNIARANRIDLKGQSLLGTTSSNQKIADAMAADTAQGVSNYLNNSDEKRLNFLDRRLNAISNRIEKNLHSVVNQDNEGNDITRIQQLNKQVTNGLANGISFGLSSAITTVLMGGDFEQALKAGFITALSVIIPQVASYAISIITGAFSAGFIAIGLIIAGLGVSLYKYIKNAKNEEEERFKSISKANKELEDEQINSINRIKQAQKEKDELEENLNTINSLQNKNFLTAEDTEALEKAQKSIQDSYPELVLSYDENNKLLTINNSKLEELNKTLQKNIDDEITESGFVAVSNKNKNIEKQEKVNGIFEDLKNIENLQDEKSVKTFVEKIVKLRQFFSEDEIDKIFTNDLFKKIDTTNIEDFNLPNSSNYQVMIENLENSVSEYFNNIIGEIKSSERKTYVENQVDNIDKTLAEVVADRAEEVSEASSYKLKKSSAAKAEFKGGILTAFGGYRGIFREKLGLDAFAEEDQGLAKKVLSNLGYEEIANESLGIKSYDDLGFTKYDNLSDSLKTALANAGYEKRDWDFLSGINRDNIFQEIIDTMAETIVNMEDTTNYVDENKDTIEKVNKAISNYTELTFSEYDQVLKDAFAGELELWTKYINDENSYYQKYKQMIDKAIAIGIEDAENLNYETLQGITDRISGFNYSEGKTGEWVNIFNSNSKGLSNDQKSILSTIDLEKSYGTLLSEAGEYAKEMANSELSVDEALKIYYNYINEATQKLGKVITNEEGVEIFLDTLKEGYSSNNEKYSTLIDAMQKTTEKGYFDWSTASKLNKAGMDKYYTWNSKGQGYVLTDDAYNIYATEQLNTYLGLENQIRTNQTNASQWKDLYGKYGNSIYEDAYKIYKETGNYGHYENTLTNDEKLFIETAKENNMSLEDLANNTDAMIEKLESSRISAQIDFLNSLGSAYSDTKDKLNEYIEKLDDYKEQLEDLEKTKEKQLKAITEAEDKLEETIHGTKNLQTGLNEFQGFDEKLKDIETKLSEINNDLEDFNEISSISTNIQSKLSLEAEQAAIKIAKGFSAQEEIAKAQAQLSDEYGTTFDENGRANLNLDYLTMDANDEERKKYEELVNYLNTNIEVAQENNKDKILKELEKSRREEIKKHYDAIAKLDENNIKVLQENAKEEVEETKKKYDALKEADNDYLEALEDAINKQRKLREMEKDDEDLAKQEKKLSLMRRDTSGANQVELAKLEEEVQDKRENSFDKKVDNVLDNLKELYKKEEELKEEELEALEAITEDVQYFAEAWQQIRDSFTSADDYVSWRLENDKNLEDLTPEQTQAKIYELQDEYNNFIVAQTSITEGLKIDQEDLLIKANEAYNNINNLSVNYIENLNELTAKTVAEAIDNAKESLENAKESYDSTIKKIEEMNEKIKKTEDQIGLLGDSTTKTYEAFINGIIGMSEHATVEFETQAAQMIADFNGIDATTESGWTELMLKMSESGFSINSNNFYQVKESVTGSGEMSAGDSIMLSLDDLAKHKSEITGPNADGGLVNYTGFAWVDGSMNKPEAFLSAEDTARIGAAAQLLSNIDFLTNGNLNTNSISSNVGDTSIEIHINVDKLSSDYDVDNLVERIKKDIVNVSKPVGSSVILAK